MVCEESVLEARKEREMLGICQSSQKDICVHNLWRGYSTEKSNHEDVFIAQLYRRACLLNTDFQNQVLVSESLCLITDS